MNDKQNKAASGITLKLFNPIFLFDAVKVIWTFLQDKCAHSYFLSWGWNEVWLKNLPGNCKVFLAAGFKNELPVIAFFIGCHDTTRHNLFKARQLSLNSTRIPYFDSVCVEYNTILIDPEIEITLEDLAEMIPIKKWDEFYLPRYAPDYCRGLLLGGEITEKYKLQIIEEDQSYQVDLESVRQNQLEYLAMLSKNKRQQVRRSLKEYQKWGALEVRVAQTVHEALAMLEELIRLHQKEWIKRGQPGAFSNEYFIKFHKNLILRRFEKGEIQMISVSAGDHPIGCLYNLLYKGHVLAYQSGFEYQQANVYRPGLVCHYLAILHNVAAGMKLYDFLAGHSQFKESLSTDCAKMQTILLQKRKMKYEIESKMKYTYQQLVKRRYVRPADPPAN